MKFFKRKNDFHTIEKTIEREKKQFEELEQMGAKKVLKWYDFGMISLRREIKAHPAQYFFLFITSFLGSVITSAVGLYGFSTNISSKLSPPVLGVSNSANTQQVQKKNYVSTEKFDASVLFYKINSKGKGFTVVDIRDSKDFKKGHIEGAVNIPVYGTELISQNGDLDKNGISKAFSGLNEANLMVIYAQNEYDSVPQAISQMIANENLTVKPLSIGWSEWSKSYIK